MSGENPSFTYKYLIKVIFYASYWQLMIVRWADYDIGAKIALQISNTSKIGANKNRKS